VRSAGRVSVGFGLDRRAPGRHDRRQPHDVDPEFPEVLGLVRQKLEVRLPRRAGERPGKDLVHDGVVEPVGGTVREFDGRFVPVRVGVGPRGRVQPNLVGDAMALAVERGGVHARRLLDRFDRDPGGVGRVVDVDVVAGRTCPVRGEVDDLNVAGSGVAVGRQRRVRGENVYPVDDFSVEFQRGWAARAGGGRRERVDRLSVCLFVRLPVAGWVDLQFENVPPGDVRRELGCVVGAVVVLGDVVEGGRRVDDFGLAPVRAFGDRPRRRLGRIAVRVALRVDDPGREVVPVEPVSGVGEDRVHQPFADLEEPGGSGSEARAGFGRCGFGSGFGRGYRRCFRSGRGRCR